MTGGLNVFPAKDREFYNSAHFASPYQPTPDLPEFSSRNEPDPEDYSEREDGETELGAVEKTFLGLSNEVLNDIIEVDGKTSQALPSSLSRTELIDFFSRINVYCFVKANHVQDLTHAAKCGGRLELSTFIHTGLNKVHGCKSTFSSLEGLRQLLPTCSTDAEMLVKQGSRTT